MLLLSSADLFYQCKCHPDLGPNLCKNNFYTIQQEERKELLMMKLSLCLVKKIVQLTLVSVMDR